MNYPIGPRRSNERVIISSKELDELLPLEKKLRNEGRNVRICKQRSFYLLVEPSPGKPNEGIHRIR
jgi:hypothetical protein